MTDIACRLRRSVRLGAIHGSTEERQTCITQMVEAANTLDRLTKELSLSDRYIDALTAEFTVERDALREEVARMRDTLRAISTKGGVAAALANQRLSSGGEVDDD